MELSRDLTKIQKEVRTETKRASIQAAKNEIKALLIRGASLPATEFGNMMRKVLSPLYGLIPFAGAPAVEPQQRQHNYIIQQPRSTH